MQLNSSTLIRKASLVLLLSLSALLIFIFSLFAETITAANRSVIIRKGSGNYYEVVTRAPKGTTMEVLEDLEDWYKVKLPDGKTGYVSKAALAREPRAERRIQYDITDEKGVGEVASSEIMAATKGLTELGTFAKKYAKKYDIDTATFEELEEIPFTEAEYARFKKKLRPRRIRMVGLSRVGTDEYDIEVGSAIAIRVCSTGINRDRDLRKYVSMVGNSLLERTTLYDERFVFIVLDNPKIASFAVPGGYIFITTGALKRMKSEAELAGVLAHEIIHVVQHHGIKEYEKQKQRIDSGKLMDSLDKELEQLEMDKGDKAVEAEMEEIADDLYEKIISGRQKEAEDESDMYGTILLPRTGYATNGLRSFLIKADKVDDPEKNSTYSHRRLSERLTLIDGTIKKYKLARRSGVDLEDRFRSNVRL